MLQSDVTSSLTAGGNERSLPTSHELALQRTSLANDRTLLAFIRTGLGLAGVSIALLKLFSGTGTIVASAAFGAFAAAVFFKGYAEWAKHKKLMKGS